MKKGEMSMAMIVGAVIAIIILAIVVFLIARSAGDTNRATACASKAGICTEFCNNGQIYDNGKVISCPSAGSGAYQVCCSPLAAGN